MPSPLRLALSAALLGCSSAAVALTIAVVAAYVVVWTQTGSPLVPLLGAQLIRAAASVVTASLVGAALGVLWPAPVAPIVAAGGVLTLGFVRQGGLSEVFAPRTGTVTLVDFRTSWLPLGLLSCGVGLLVVAALLAVLAGVGRHRPRVVAAASAVVAVAALVGPLRQNAVLEPYVTSGIRIGECSENLGHPQVCVSYDSGFDADLARSDLASLARPLQDLGVTVPARFVQGGGAAFDGGQPLIETPLSAATSRIPTEDLVRALARPAMCPEYRQDLPPERSLVARAVVEVWLASRLDLAPAGLSPEQDRYVRSAEADGWVRATYPRLSSCALDEIALPAEFRVREGP